jgi:hypothetical protein
MNEDEPRQGISRRRALKRIGVAAGIAWTAPIVASIRTPAFAGSPVAGCSDQDFVCGGPLTVCGQGNNGLDCFCEKGSSGSTICVNDLFCDDGLTVCTSDTDCPSGWICAADSCCGTVCLPPCGGASLRVRSSKTAKESRRTASGR